MLREYEYNLKKIYNELLLLFLKTAENRIDANRRFGENQDDEFREYLCSDEAQMDSPAIYFSNVFLHECVVHGRLNGHYDLEIEDYASAISRLAEYYTHISNHASCAQLPEHFLGIKLGDIYKEDPHKKGNSIVDHIKRHFFNKRENSPFDSRLQDDVIRVIEYKLPDGKTFMGTAWIALLACHPHNHILGIVTYIEDPESADNAHLESLDKVIGTIEKKYNIKMNGLCRLINMGKTENCSNLPVLPVFKYCLHKQFVKVNSSVCSMCRSDDVDKQLIYYYEDKRKRLTVRMIPARNSRSLIELSYYFTNWQSIADECHARNLVNEEKKKENNVNSSVIINKSDIDVL